MLESQNFDPPRHIQHDTMKQTATGLSQRHVAALRKHLRQGRAAAAPNGTATRLGQNSKGLKNEIASTQRLVVKSARSVRQVARGFRNA